MGSPSSSTQPTSPKINTIQRFFALAGPAFVAAIAYVDPGNVASNVAAGAQYRYVLLWVLTMASIMAIFLQFQSAKLGIVTGKSLPTLLGERIHNKYGRIAFWLQAEIMAISTDVAEIVGGALALNLLFNISLPVAAVITVILSTVLLIIQAPATQRRFELAIISLLFLILLGFLLGLILHPPSVTQMASGLVPHFADKNSVLISVSMIGATVMPHALYAHSGLVNERFSELKNSLSPRKLLSITRADVGIALFFASLANIGLLVLAANSLADVPNIDTIEDAYFQIKSHLGSIVAIFFGVGLLASGIASSSVGTYAGSVIMDGLIHKKISVLTRRLISCIPALIIVCMGFAPSTILIWSQVILSLCIPCAVFPLIKYTSDKKIMGAFTDSLWLRILSVGTATIIVALNGVLLYLQFV